MITFQRTVEILKLHKTACQSKIQRLIYTIEKEKSSRLFIGKIRIGWKKTDSQEIIQHLNL